MVSRSDMATYPLPAFLTGTVTHTVYTKWLNIKSDALLKLDRKRKKPYAVTASISLYKTKIHQAVLDSGLCDPYTGDALRWDLIGTWDTSHDQVEGYKARFALMPTVDHTNPKVLAFEICSWRVNDSKSDMDPAEFVDFCKKVVAHCAAGPEPPSCRTAHCGSRRFKTK